MIEHPQGRADLELVRRVLAGRSDAIATFVERMRCVPRILAARNARAGRPLAPEELADLAQEVFALVWRKLDDYRGEARIEAWTHPFCLLQFMNHVRKKARRRATTELTELDADPGGAAAASAAAAVAVDPLDASLVHEALARLGDAEKVVIRMKQFDELTFEEIAVALDVSINTAKTRYYRGLTRLRASLGPRFDEEQAS